MATKKEETYQIKGEELLGKVKQLVKEGNVRRIVIKDKKGKELISDIVISLYRIARMLNPIMPETNILLKKLIKENKKPEKPLFPRKN